MCRCGIVTTAVSQQYMCSPSLRGFSEDMNILDNRFKSKLAIWVSMFTCTERSSYGHRSIGLAGLLVQYTCTGWNSIHWQKLYVLFQLVSRPVRSHAIFLPSTYPSAESTNSKKNTHSSSNNLEEESMCIIPRLNITCLPLLSFFLLVFPDSTLNFL